MSSKIDYKSLVDNSMRSVVREILRNVQENGLHGDQHYFITFQTNFPGVVLSKDMLEKYPTEITIVIQYQFWDLYVKKNIFSINLSFGSNPQTIVVPFNSITSFVDPSEDFAIQLERIPYNPMEISDEEESDENLEKLPYTAPPKPIEKEEKIGLPTENEDNVVALDSFRKKQ